MIKVEQIIGICILEARYSIAVHSYRELEKSTALPKNMPLSGSFELLRKFRS
jgi:hypothetical protein